MTPAERAQSNRAALLLVDAVFELDDLMQDEWEFLTPTDREAVLVAVEYLQRSANRLVR